MREALDKLEGLIEFHGLNFRATRINCKHCGWEGTGGSLMVPQLAQTGQTVVYACPQCMESVAVHKGLKDQEVMAEMEKIRKVLAEEMVDTLMPSADADKPAPKLDYAAIRQQLPTEVDAEQESAADGAADDLDFATIRARLNEPA